MALLGEAHLDQLSQLQFDLKSQTPFVWRYQAELLWRAAGILYEQISAADEVWLDRQRREATADNSGSGRRVLTPDEVEIDRTVALVGIY